MTDLNARYKELDALWSLDVDPRGLPVDRRQRRLGQRAVLPAVRRRGRRAAADGGRDRRGAQVAGLRRQLRRHAAPRLPDRPAPRRATGARCSTPTPRATAAPASATSAASRRSRSRGTASRSRRPWPLPRWAPSGSCTRAESGGRHDRGCRRAGAAGRVARPGMLPSPTAPAGSAVLPRRRPSMGLLARRGLRTGSVIGRAEPGRWQRRRRRHGPGRRGAGRRGVPTGARPEVDRAGPQRAGRPGDLLEPSSSPRSTAQEFHAAAGRLLQRRPRRRRPRASTRTGVGCGLRPAGGRRATPSTARPRGARTPTRSPTTGRSSTSWPTSYGRFLPALVMAHEFGHAVQGRVGCPAPSIATETQADCLAGAWTALGGRRRGRALAAPRARARRRAPRLPAAARPGRHRAPREQSAHGSYFDRVSAFQEGFDGGVGGLPRRLRRRTGCSPRARSTTTTTSDRRQRHLRRDLIDIVDDVAARRSGSEAFRDGLRRRLRRPAARAVRRRRRPTARRTATATSSTAPTRTSWRSTSTDLTRPAYELGDFAVATAVAIPYAWPPATSSGCRPTTSDAIRSARLPDRLVRGEGLQRRPATTGAAISPGDIDESVQFLLDVRQRPGRCSRTST